MKLKSVIMDETAVYRSMTRITHEIIEKNSGLNDVILLGILRRGVPLSVMLQQNMLRFEGVTVPVGTIDISLYRDDLSRICDLPETGSCVFPCDITGKKVVLVDDVIFTGRTVRAAIDAVFRHGRPQSVQLAVLIDRGHRELPIRPDYIGKNIPTSHSEMVSVMVNEYDNQTGVCLYQL